MCGDACAPLVVEPSAMEAVTCGVECDAGVRRHTLYEPCSADGMAAVMATVRSFTLHVLEAMGQRHGMLYCWNVAGHWPFTSGIFSSSVHASAYVHEPTLSTHGILTHTMPTSFSSSSVSWIGDDSVAAVQCERRHEGARAH